MQLSKFILLLLMCTLLVTTLACTNDTEEGTDESENAIENEGEEPGQQLGNDETFDAVRNGVRLVLAYDKASSSFLGTVENVTEASIAAVRVEVHLSNGVELGPTRRINLISGQKEQVSLSAKGQSFNWWKAHAETNEGGGEHTGEHDEEHKEEHGSEHGEEH